MPSFTPGYLAIAALSLVLAACQSSPGASATAPADAIARLEGSIAQGRLAAADEQLAALQQRAAGDRRLEALQRQLADAYLERGQNALQHGDLDAATHALGRARSLKPQAPALTTGLDAAISQARKAQSRTVPLPMLDARDAAALRALRARLDQVAAEVVDCQCQVRIQVRQRIDYPWVASLLEAGVRRRQPDFSLRLSEALQPDEPPQLLLSPARP